MAFASTLEQILSQHDADGRAYSVVITKGWFDVLDHGDGYMLVEPVINPLPSSKKAQVLLNTHMIGEISVLEH